ncbi:MAG: hypothetical protein BGO78_00805 [Chloroflexi bacterium 44-23]|nr:MAG: hypothetical protein BGO78_00805 [Chloroflexi bacterium 44-23]
MEFENRVVVVTGAGSGIGKATALTFAKAGAKLVLGDIDGNSLKELTTLLAKNGTQAVGVQGDISKEEDCEALIGAARSTFGQVDILINNAGIMDRFLPVGELDNYTWKHVLAVNLEGVFFTMRAVIPMMIARSSGTIVNIGSVAGIGGGYAGAAYTTSKHALVGLTKNTAVMYAKQGLRCNIIVPGGVETGISLGGNPSELGYSVLEAALKTMPRSGKAEEVANVILFVSSDKASFINGAVIEVDGGWLAQG